MQISPKYHIHAEIRTSGVVERSDVVGAVFGQTEGLLGDELDLRDLQEASKIGRIDVSVDSEDGRSFGTISITSGLDRVETAVLAASLETIERVGPCRADCTVIDIEDARAAKRRELVDRATELLAEVEDETMTSENLIDAVRQRARVEDITEYEGLPAGPRVADSDAIIVVEGRADVRRLLRFGIKNAVAVEGTDIPDPVARLTRERTTTAFLDGDRGGDLILRELKQVGDVDYVAFAPRGRSVEDLDRSAIMSALRKKIPYDQALQADSPRAAFAPDEPAVEPEDVEDAGDHPTVEPDAPDEGPEPETTGRASSADGGVAQPAATPATEQRDEQTDESPSAASDEQPAPQTLAGHVEAIIGAGTGRARLLDESYAVREETAADGAFDAIEAADEPPHAVVLDGTITQRLLDIAAQRGVGRITGADAGEFVKQPAAVRVQTVEEG